MAREIGRLTALGVQRLGPGMHADGGGLYLRVTASGSRSWIWRYMIAGRAREMGLGPVHTVGLAEARKRAQEARLKKLDGADPIALRQERRQAGQVAAANTIVFRQASREFIAARQGVWKNPKHGMQWSATLEHYAFPVFGDLPVRAVDTGLVLRALEPIWNKKPETASRVRGRIEAVLDWAATRGYREGENPARWKGHLALILADPAATKRAKQRQEGRGRHFAALPYQDIPEFMARLRERDAVSRQALEFTVLTAMRSETVLGARGRELRAGDKVWAIPAERMKADRDFELPLSDAAWRLVAGAGPDDYLFASPNTGAQLSNNAMRKLLQDDLGYGKSATPHGFRSTFRDWAAERTNFPREVAEMALAHAISDKVEAAYRRGDLFAKRRQLMEAWAKYCASPAAAAGDIVALRRA